MQAKDKANMPHLIDFTCILLVPCMGQFLRSARTDVCMDSVLYFDSAAEGS